MHARGGGKPCTGVDLSAVEALLAKSLLVTTAHDGGEPRVRMLEPVRAYAVERLEERPDAEDLRRRHCEYYVSLAERAEPALRGSEQMAWLGRVYADRANFRTAVLWSLHAGRPELGLRLASALVRAGRLQTETRGWLEATLDAAADLEPHLHAKGRLALGLIMGGGPAAMEQVRQSLRLFEAQSDAHGAAEALIALSVDTDQAGDPGQAADLARRALELARSTGDEWLIACSTGSTDARIARELPADQALRGAGSRHGAPTAVIAFSSSVALGNLGFAAMSAGDYAAAAPDLDEAVALAEELEDGRLLPFHDRQPRDCFTSCRAPTPRPRATSPERCSCVARTGSRSRSPRRSPVSRRSQFAEATCSWPRACRVQRTLSVSFRRSASWSYGSESTSSTPLERRAKLPPGDEHGRQGTRSRSIRRSPRASTPSSYPISAAGPAFRRGPLRGPK